MREHGRHFGFTLVEMLVVMALMAAVLALVLPAYSLIIEGAKQSQMDNAIKAALGAARTHAIKTQKYAGVRFQFDRDGWRKGRQYAVLIEKGTDLSNTYQFVAVPNIRPLTMPKGMGVIVESGVNFDTDDEILDGTTFSILFSPRGKLSVLTVQMYRRDDNDTIFGNQAAVQSNPEPGEPPAPLLYYDNNSWDQTDSVSWAEYEPSMLGLYVFDVATIGGMKPGERYDRYVSKLAPVLINRYTGSIIE